MKADEMNEAATPSTGSRRSSRARWRRFTVGGAGLAALSLVAGVGLTSCGGSSKYSVTAIFPSAEGLFAGNAVDVLGVGRGTVTKVTPQAGQVVVVMSINGAQALPADVHATLTDPQLLGEPSIELSPGYTSGPKLADQAVIPESRTAVPESIDQLLKDLQNFLGQVNTQSLSGLISNLAQDLQGQGQGLNALIANGAGTLQILADKGTQLGQLNGSLAQVTSTLRQREATVTNLIQSYDQVAGTLSSQAGPLGDSITQLAQTSAELTKLLAPNLTPLQSDIGTITQVGRTLDRNLSSLDQGLSSSVALFAAAQKAYDPVHMWLNLNDQLAPGTTSGVIEGLVRDRLAGICRRVLANHSSGLSSSAISTLQTCGNPDSGYFDSILGLIPSVLTSASSGSTSPPSPQSLISQGAAEIPGLSSAQQSSVSSVPPSSLQSSQSQVGGGAQLAPSPPLTTQQQANSTSNSGLLGGLIDDLLGVTSGVGHFFGSVGHFFGSLL